MLEHTPEATHQFEIVMSLEDLFNQMVLQDLYDFIKTHQEEHLQLDFKTINKSDLSHKDDKKNLAKALSGFANSAGGIIVWGIIAKKVNNVDCASATQVIDNLPQFISRLNDLTGQAVSPLVDSVRHKAIPESATGDTGYAITIIPESDSGPHMAKLAEDRYFKRSGDSFYRMEHFDLEDMFGRRRRPSLQIKVEVTSLERPGKFGAKFLVLLSVENQGRGSAKAPFMSVKLPPSTQLYQYGVDGNGSLGLPLIKRHVGSSGERHFGASPNIAIHPGTILDVAKLAVPGTGLPGDLSITGRFAAEDMRPSNFHITVPQAEFKAVHDRYTER